MFARAASVLAAAILLSLAGSPPPRTPASVSSRPTPWTTPLTCSTASSTPSRWSVAPSWSAARSAPCRLDQEDHLRARQPLRLRPGHRPVLPGFAPSVRGPVHALAAGDARHRLCRRRLLLRSTATGAPLWPGSACPTDQPVASVRAADRRRRGHRTGPARRRPLRRRRLHRAARRAGRLNATTGAPDPGFTITPGGSLTRQVRVHALAATANRLLVDGSFTTLAGRSRPQLGLIDIDRPYGQARELAQRRLREKVQGRPFPTTYAAWTSHPTAVISWSSPPAGRAAACATARPGSRPMRAARASNRPGSTGRAVTRSTRCR